MRACFTESARRVLFYARCEVAQWGGLFIDTGHLWLGLLREHRSHPVALLPASPMPEQLRQRLEALVASAGTAPGDIDLPFSPACRRAMRWAEEESSHLGQKDVDASHLLLGLLREPDGGNAALLQGAGLELEALRRRLRASGPLTG